MQPPLAPTLWRTCRVLSGQTRLRLLEALLRRGPGCVEELAKAAGVERTLATVGLRALQARGLLRATRTGRWVRYEFHSDASVRHAGAILQVITGALRRKEPLEGIARAATAFTHPRRIIIVQVLAKEPATLFHLAARSRISVQALYRHLHKLSRRGLVVSENEVWKLAPPESVTLRALLDIALQD